MNCPLSDGQMEGEGERTVFHLSSVRWSGGIRGRGRFRGQPVRMRATREVYLTASADRRRKRSTDAGDTTKTATEGHGHGGARKRLETVGDGRDGG